MKIDKKIIKELSDYLDEFNLTELEYTNKDTKIKVSKNNISTNTQSSFNKNFQITQETKKKIDEKKNELRNLKEKFLEIKKLVYAYKDDKEIEIKNLLNNHQDLKSEIDRTKLDYEKILDEATSEIDKFIEKVNQDSSVQ